MKKSVLESIIRRVIRESEDLTNSEVDIKKVHDIFVEKIAKNLNISKMIGRMISMILEKVIKKIDSDVALINLTTSLANVLKNSSVNQKIQEIMMKGIIDTDTPEIGVIRGVVKKLSNSLTSYNFISEIMYEIMYDNLDVTLSEFDPYKYDDSNIDALILHKEKFEEYIASTNSVEKTGNRIAATVIRWIFYTGRKENSDIFENLTNDMLDDMENNMVLHNGEEHPFFYTAKSFENM